MEIASADLTLYWFMFPVSILIATTAMLSGIGGAAYFVPVFWIIFPILGPEYIIGDAQVIAAALFTEVFGFSSGFVGYFKKRLIDFRVGRAFIIFSAPAAIGGAVLLIADIVSGAYLQLIYGLMMLLIAYILFRGQGPEEILEEAGSRSAGGLFGVPARRSEARQTTDNQGKVHKYRFHRPRRGAAPLIFGGFLTGLVGVGIGEVTIPLLVRRYRIPVAVAAATSIFVVIITVMSASFSQIIGLTNKGGLAAIPWNLIMYTVPAVIIGGQIGPRLQGVIAAHTVERTIAVLFLGIAIAFLWLVYGKLFGV